MANKFLVFTYKVMHTKMRFKAYKWVPKDFSHGMQHGKWDITMQIGYY